MSRSLGRNVQLSTSTYNCGNHIHTMIWLAEMEALKVLNCRNSRNNTEGSCRIPQLIKLSVSTGQTCLSLQPSPARRHHPHHNHQHAFLLDFRADMHPNTRYLILSRQATLLSSKYCKQFKSLCVINPLTWTYCVV